MRGLAKPVARLVEELSRLPGIGPKTASRLTFYLLRAPKEQVKALSQAIGELKEKIVTCEICYNITEVSPCPICRDEERNRSLLCVVEEP
ncbi:MAG TPA: recombination protein RecR, partial [Chloroflexi bacterium]|nr:recombination protein RecR [Chloroflexota bacterium]